jgi:hypothetical protein
MTTRTTALAMLRRLLENQVFLDRLRSRSESRCRVEQSAARSGGVREDARPAREPGEALHCVQN